MVNEMDGNKMIYSCIIMNNKVLAVFGLFEKANRFARDPLTALGRDLGASVRAA